MKSINDDGSVYAARPADDSFDRDWPLTSPDERSRIYTLPDETELKSHSGDLVKVSSAGISSVGERATSLTQKIGEKYNYVSKSPAWVVGILGGALAVILAGATYIGLFNRASSLISGTPSPATRDIKTNLRDIILNTRIHARNMREGIQNRLNEKSTEEIQNEINDLLLQTSNSGLSYEEVNFILGEAIKEFQWELDQGWFGNNTAKGRTILKFLRDTLKQREETLKQYPGRDMSHE